eukprot:6693914-Pyramimonas_sp.AAC.1
MVMMMMMMMMVMMMVMLMMMLMMMVMLILILMTMLMMMMMLRRRMRRMSLGAAAEGDDHLPIRPRPQIAADKLKAELEQKGAWAHVPTCVSAALAGGGQILEVGDGEVPSD